MAVGKKTPDVPNNRKDLAKSLPEFDAAMRKIVATPKAEVERREQEEKQRKRATE